MKNYKIFIISLLMVIVCTLCSCGNSSTDKADKNQATKTKATTQATTDSDDRMCLFKKDKNYEIYQYRYNEYSFEYVFLFMITNTEELIAKMFILVSLILAESVQIRLVRIF